MPGILAIWNDLEEGADDLFERWYVDEHIPERLAVPGFGAAHRYESQHATPRFFCYYEVAAPEVLASPDYLGRLAAPTALTRQVMPHFRNMIRTVCSIAGRSPRFALGGWVAASRIEGLVTDDCLRTAAAACERHPGVLGVQWWRAAEQTPSAATTESRLRPGGDRSIRAALIAEAMRERDAAAAAAGAAAILGPNVQTGLYCTLGHWSSRREL